jgi:hypothetical protein
MNGSKYKAADQGTYLSTEHELLREKGEKKVIK